MLTDVLNWLHKTLGSDPQHWPEQWNQGIGSARDGFKLWAQTKGLTGIIAEPGLWLVVLAVSLLLLRVAFLSMRASRPARQSQSSSADTSPFMAPDSISRDDEVSDGIGRYLAFGSVLAGLLVIGAGGWAWTTELAGAVLAQGTVVVDSKVKKVQHPTGGVVGEINVKDGDTVKAGDILIRLDETVTRANLLTVTKQLDEIAVRKARLLAEQNGAGDVPWPVELLQRQDDPVLSNILQTERGLFENRRTARDGQRSQFKERVAQLTSEIDGMKGQITGKAAEVKLTQEELDRMIPLETARLVPASKMTGARRDVARLKGEHSQLLSSMAQAKQKIAETELQILQLNQDMRSEVSRDLRELQGKEAELIERKVTARDQLTRLDIRAPQAGKVLQLAVHTIGGVIAQGEPIMLIVPEDDPLVIEAKISPSDIDHVRTNQTAFVRFPAFNQRTTPEFNGYVTVLSADLTRDTTSGQPGPPYYLARIALTAEDQIKMGALKLVPGMPAEVHIETPSRTAMSYIVKPLVDQIALAFKER